MTRLRHLKRLHCTNFKRKWFAPLSSGFAALEFLAKFSTPRAMFELKRFVKANFEAKATDCNPSPLGTSSQEFVLL